MAQETATTTEIIPAYSMVAFADKLLGDQWKEWLEVVPMQVNGSRVQVPLGLFNLYSDFYKNVPAEMQKFHFEYALDGTPYDFGRFIRAVILSTRKKYIRTIIRSDMHTALCMAIAPSIG